MLSHTHYWILSLVFCAVPLTGQTTFEKDQFQTYKGPLEITFIGHGTLMFEWNGKVVHVDPVSQYADYSRFPKADLILITHEHGDHLDAQAIDRILKSDTTILVNPSSGSKLGKGSVIQNGETTEVSGIRIRAVPAYNTTPGRDRFHPKGRDNGYILTFAGTTVYVAGDTEDIPEMKELSGIDIAFLPMNQPYTMTPEQVVSAARMIRPRILYPYHYGDTPVQELINRMKGEPGIEIRIRKLN